MTWINDESEDESMMARFFSHYITPTERTIVAKQAVAIQPVLAEDLSYDVNLFHVTENIPNEELKEGDITQMKSCSTKCCFEANSPSEFFYIMKDAAGRIKYFCFTARSSDSYTPHFEWRVTKDNNFIKAFKAKYGIDLRTGPPYALPAAR